MTLDVSNLSVARGGLPVLVGVSFTLSPGEALILRGPNGIGKTTLLRTLAGLQPPVRGEITHSPEDIVYAGHADGVKATLTVEENLRFWAEAFGHGNTDAALEAFDLTTLRDRPAGQLSAGQKRRLGLSRLMVTGRSIWLLDEPTVSLDTATVALFSDILGAHIKAGGSTLVATHIDLPLASARVLDIGPYQAKLSFGDAFDEAFL